MASSVFKLRVLCRFQVCHSSSWTLARSAGRAKGCFQFPGCKVSNCIFFLIFIERKEERKQVCVLISVWLSRQPYRRGKYFSVSAAAVVTENEDYCIFRMTALAVMFSHLSNVGF